MALPASVIGEREKAVASRCMIMLCTSGSNPFHSFSNDYTDLTHASCKYRGRGVVAVAEENR
jgi:hypothetical protein